MTEIIMDRCDADNIAKATYSVDDIPFKFDENSTMPVGSVLLCDHHMNKYMAHCLTSGYSINRI